MGTFDDLNVGDRFVSPVRAIDASTIADAIANGGYTHPLFTDPSFAARSAFGGTPAPGEAVLLWMGGLAEETGRFDETTIALTGFESVRFLKPVLPGDAIHVEIEIVGKEPHPRTGALLMRWLCVGADGAPRCDASARMLFRTG